MEATVATTFFRHCFDDPKITLSGKYNWNRNNNRIYIFFLFTRPSSSCPVWSTITNFWRPRIIRKIRHLYSIRKFTEYLAQIFKDCYQVTFMSFAMQINIILVILQLTKERKRVGVSKENTSEFLNASSSIAGTPSIYEW